MNSHRPHNQTRYSKMFPRPRLISIILSIFWILVFIFPFESLASITHLRSFDPILSSEPEFYQILEVYFRREGLRGSDLSDYERRIKKAPYLPTLYLGYDHALKKTQGLSVNDNISISSGNITIGPEDNDYDYDENLGNTIRVRAVWRLDELIFNSNYLALSRERRGMVGLRSVLEKEIYKLYEARYQILFQYLENKNQSSKKADLFYAKYLLLTNQLDALTGKEFAKQWWKEGSKK